MSRSILRVNFPGNPVPEIKWLKDGQPLVPDRRHQVLSHGRFLQISGAQVADTGRYSCLASNSAGDRSRHYNLNVLGTETTLESFHKQTITRTFEVDYSRTLHSNGLCSCSFLLSFPHHSWVGSWWLCRGGDSDFEQPHLSRVWSPVLPPCSHHLAQRRHSLWIQPQCPSASRFEITKESERNEQNTEQS